ncbi:unnamed protein product [Owenia fusiformis]|uniref:Uncharacterized protein n=1 Tax=Owenia fusiformis TaxID=6347 RepID=A0A8J1UF56_OWEFU|nr:unnamed protein product [Owenia fusiformis]
MLAGCCETFTHPTGVPSLKATYTENTSEFHDVRQLSNLSPIMDNHIGLDIEITVINVTDDINVATYAEMYYDNNITSAGKVIPRWEVYIEAILLFIVMVFGVFGNIMILIAALVSEKLRKPLHLLILNMAFVDFLTCAIACPFHVYGIVNHEWRLGQMWCDFARAILSMVLGVSLLSNTAIAVNRYCSSSVLSKSRKIVCSKVGTLVIILFIWLSVFSLLVMPQITGFIIISFIPEYGYCTPASPYKNTIIYYVYSYAIGFIIPFIATCICYYKIFCVIRERLNLLRTERSRQEFIRASKRMAMIFTVFCICWLPDFIHNIIFLYTDITEPWIIRGLAILLLSNSAINPFIYAHKISAFRLALSELFAAKKVDNASSDDRRVTPSRLGSRAARTVGDTTFL